MHQLMKHKRIKQFLSGTKINMKGMNLFKINQLIFQKMDHQIKIQIKTKIKIKIKPQIQIDLNQIKKNKNLHKKQLSKMIQIIQMIIGKTLEIQMKKLITQIVKFKSQKLKNNKIKESQLDQNLLNLHKIDQTHKTLDLKVENKDLSLKMLMILTLMITLILKMQVKIKVWEIQMIWEILIKIQRKEKKF